MGRNNIIIFLSLLFLVLPLSLPAKIVSSQGVVLIENNDTISAKKSALHDAFVKAVSEIIEELLPEIKGSLDKIHLDPAKYIESYRIVEEYRSENIYYLNIECNVSGKKLYEDLVNLGVIEGKPQDILINITNIYSYKIFSEILEALRNTMGVKDIHYERFKKGEATLRVDVIGRKEVFFKELSALEFKGFNLEIKIDEGEGKVTLNIISG